MKSPSILLAKPEPKIVQKQFHGKKVMVWDGVAKVESVHGWVSNPRLELEIKRFRDQHAGRDPDNEEIFGIMKSVKDFKLKELADDIRVNGVRVPIVITGDGKLLDGNRRYYAVRLLLETMKNDHPERSDFEVMPVWVLEKASLDDEQRILVQENFYASLKVEWPDYVKAQRVYSDLQAGNHPKTVAQRYNWSASKVNETKKIMELVDEFTMFATTNPGDEVDGLGLSDIEAERIAADKYQFFNEAQKSLTSVLDTDIEFKQNFFRWIYEGKFASFAEVRVAGDAWNNEKAKRILMSDDPKGGKKAKAIIDYEKNFEKEVIEVEEEIDGFVKFLGELTTEQKKELSEESLLKLENALSTVVGMIKSYKKVKH